MQRVLQALGLQVLQRGEEEQEEVALQGYLQFKIIKDKGREYMGLIEH